MRVYLGGKWTTYEQAEKAGNPHFEVNGFAKGFLLGGLITAMAGAAIASFIAGAPVFAVAAITGLVGGLAGGIYEGRKAIPEPQDYKIKILQERAVPGQDVERAQTHFQDLVKQSQESMGKGI